MVNGLFAPPLLAIYLQQVIENTLGGPHIPWWALAIACVLISVFLAYRRIDLSAKVMFWVMLLEVIIIVIFDVAAFVHGTPANSGRRHVHMAGFCQAGHSEWLCFWDSETSWDLRLL